MTICYSFTSYCLIISLFLETHYSNKFSFLFSNNHPKFRKYDEEKTKLLSKKKKYLTDK